MTPQGNFRVGAVGWGVVVIGSSFYLLKGANRHVARICADMRFEKPARMASIRAELVGVSEEQFWEVTDRGVNFDYLEPARKERLDEFFARASLR